MTSMAVIKHAQASSALADPNDMDTKPDVSMLMNAEDGLYVDFFDWATDSSSAGAPQAECLVESTDDDCDKLQMILALLRGNTKLAVKLAERYRKPLEESAAAAVIAAVTAAQKAPLYEDYEP
jgi:hypothetical protein